MKVFIDGIGGYSGWNIAAQVDKRHSLSGSLYASTDAAAASRRPSVTDDRLVTSVVDERAEQFLAEADVIIVPALESLATAMDVLKRVTQLQYQGSKTFICVSSVMTWARTKRSGKPLEESGFKARQSSVKFQDLKNFENIVLNCNSSKLHTVVIGAGITYGNGEAILETFFRDAWLFPDELLGVPVLGQSDGKNVIPMVHVVDLARLVASLVEPAYTLSGKQGLYVLAVDDSRSTLVDVVAVISSAMGSGKIRYLVDFEIQDLMIENPHAASSLQVNLEFSKGNTYAAGLAAELKWHCKAGLVANIHVVSQEFVEFRALVAPRVSVLGPPGLDIAAHGASLSAYYQVPLLTQQSIEEEMTVLGEAGSEDPAVRTVVEFAEAQKKAKKGAAKPMAPEQVVEMFKWKLAQAECHNKGWVMVGFPNTAKEAELLCTHGKEEVAAAASGNGDAGGIGIGDAQVTTYHVNQFRAPRKLVVLDSSNSDLEQRVTRLSDEEIAARFGDVQAFQKALALYRSTHPLDGGAVSNEAESQYFLQTHCDIDALQLRMLEPGGAGEGSGGGVANAAPTSGRPPISGRPPTSSGPAPESTTSSRIVDMCRLYIENGRGKPFNYRPTRQERVELERQRREQMDADLEKRQVQAGEARRAETGAREQEELELEQRRNKFIQQEMQMLEKRAMPLREYLMESVVPILTEGLLEVC
jgi:adenylate kinase